MQALLISLTTLATLLQGLAASPLLHAQPVATTTVQTQTAAAILASASQAPATTTTNTALPYQSTNFSDWTGTWGTVSPSNDPAYGPSLSIKATTTTTGAEAILPSSQNWTDYTMSANMNISNGDVSLLVRRLDDDNFYACSFSGPSISLQQRIDGTEQTVASGYVEDIPTTLSVNKNINVSATAQGNVISCSALGGIQQASYTITDSKFTTGGIGISTWNPTPGIADLELRNVTVEKN